MVAAVLGRGRRRRPPPTDAAPGQAPAQSQPSPVHRVSNTVADASEPSISSDGRWVVFAGLVGDRQSVFRTDRQTNTTVEMSPVPPGVRAGNTIHPRLSADGCVIAAVTEIPFDLFRDDDRDDRWDVYRLVVPECGGQPNAWELVSGIEFTGHRHATTCSPTPPPHSLARAHRSPTSTKPRTRPTAWPRSASSTSPCRSTRRAAYSRSQGCPRRAGRCVQVPRRPRSGDLAERTSPGVRLRHDRL